jgi:hypothetical protein
MLASSLKFERAIGRLEGFPWRQEARWPELHSCVLPASLRKSRGRRTRASEGVSANARFARPQLPAIPWLMRQQVAEKCLKPVPQGLKPIESQALNIGTCLPQAS